MTSHIDFVLREHTPEDQGLIFNSFMVSQKHTYPMLYSPNALYYPEATKRAHKLTSCQQSICLMVACFPEDPGQIIGWMAYDITKPDVDILHYIYVKSKYRRTHIATDMLLQVFSKPVLIVSHICNDYGKLRTKLPGIRMAYDPFLMQRITDGSI